jgi:hypothetical protein
VFITITANDHGLFTLRGLTAAAATHGSYFATESSQGNFLDEAGKPAWSKTPSTVTKKLGYCQSETAYVPKVRARGGRFSHALWRHEIRAARPAFPTSSRKRVDPIDVAST